MGGLGNEENKNDIHRILHFIAKINKKQKAKKHRTIFSDDLIKRKNEEMKKKKAKILQRERRDSEVTQKRSFTTKANIAQQRTNYKHPLPIFKRAKNNYYNRPLPAANNLNKTRSLPSKPKSNHYSFTPPPPPPPKNQKHQNNKNVPFGY